MRPQKTIVGFPDDIFKRIFIAGVGIKCISFFWSPSVVDLLLLDKLSAKLRIFSTVTFLCTARYILYSDGCFKGLDKYSWVLSKSRPVKMTARKQQSAEWGKNNSKVSAEEIAGNPRIFLGGVPWTSRVKRHKRMHGDGERGVCIGLRLKSINKVSVFIKRRKDLLLLLLVPQHGYACDIKTTNWNACSFNAVN